MINDKADNFQYINQKSSRRISRINPPEMAKGNVGTCDRRKEEAERGQKFFRIEATFRNPVFLRGPKSLDFTGFFAFYVFSNISKFPKLSLKNPYFPTLCRNTFLFCFISLNNFIFPTKLLGFIVFDDCTFLKCYNIFQCQKVCNLLMFLMI